MVMFDRILVLLSVFILSYGSKAYCQSAMATEGQRLAEKSEKVEMNLNKSFNRQLRIARIEAEAGGENKKIRAFVN